MSKKIKKEPVLLVGENTIKLSDDDEEEEEKETFREDGYRCEICEKMFSIKMSMKRHCKMAHFGKIQGKIIFECKICLKQYKKSKYLARHVKKCHGK